MKCTYKFHNITYTPDDVVQNSYHDLIGRLLDRVAIGIPADELADVEDIAVTIEMGGVNCRYQLVEKGTEDEAEG